MSIAASRKISLTTVTQREKAAPVLYFAAAGALIFLFQLYVLGNWAFGPEFVATPTGPDPISPAALDYYLLLEIAVPIGALVLLWYVAIRPWIRERRLTTDGMIAFSCGMIFFWDQSMNYTATALLYNSHLFNRGSWGSTSSFPGWMSPNAQFLPEPIFITIPGYTALVFSQALFICWLLRRARRRWPELSVAATVGLIVLGLTIVDSAIEVALLRMGIYAYPGAIRWLTLFAGETYQFPMTEGILFGGFGIGATAALSLFRNDRGETLVERGLQHLTFGPVARQWVKFFAIYGFVHGMFFLLYTVPNQWLSLHSDPFPSGYPSYLINNMCVYGPNADQCPGPGVSIPRPTAGRL